MSMAGVKLFDHLKEACAWEWNRYIRHEFVRRLGDGTLPESAFRHYLQQDYLFLIHFARAYALAGYKAETLADLRAAAATMSALVDTEMRLHVGYCAGWGLTEAEMEALPEEPATIAYTRFVLERGMAGDLLDLHVALAPCVIGYAEIGQWLDEDPATLRDDNPYADWIAMYAGADYQKVAAAAAGNLDLLMARRGGSGRLDALVQTFRAATELEVSFWQMGLDRG
ncbi:MAG: thiaminase II [Alphaproteobacteria bacterium]|nr:thiaminase II [Alphaproteobacteria bacterium]